MFHRTIGFALLAGLLASSPARAQFGGYQPKHRPQSGTSFYSGPNGITSVTRAGQTEFYNFPNGQTATAQHIGNHTFLNGSRGSSAITDFGSTSIYNGPGGISGSSHRFGNMQTFQFSNGGSGTVNNYGGFSTYDFNGPGLRRSSGTVMPLGGATRPQGSGRNR